MQIPGIEKQIPGITNKTKCRFRVSIKQKPGITNKVKCKNQKIKQIPSFGKQKPGIENQCRFRVSRSRYPEFKQNQVQIPGFQNLIPGILNQS
jgi:hypothetical protein